MKFLSIDVPFLFFIFKVGSQNQLKYQVMQLPKYMYTTHAPTLELDLF